MSREICATVPLDSAHECHLCAPSPADLMSERSLVSSHKTDDADDMRCHRRTPKNEVLLRAILMPTRTRRLGCRPCKQRCPADLLHAATHPSACSATNLREQQVTRKQTAAIIFLHWRRQGHPLFCKASTTPRTPSKSAECNLGRSL